MPETPFPVGAWVRDEVAGRLTGGLERGQFRPFSGEVVSIGTVGGSLAYRIRFADREAIVFTDAARCAMCGAKDDVSHYERCPDAPDGVYRAAEHEPGYAPDSEAVRAFEATGSSDRSKEGE